MNAKTLKTTLAAFLLAATLAFTSPAPAAPLTGTAAPAATLAMEVGTTAS